MKTTNKSRRYRTAFTTEQLMHMEYEFERNQYLTTTRRNELADELGLSKLTIRNWFQNRRMKTKTGERLSVLAIARALAHYAPNPIIAQMPVTMPVTMPSEMPFQNPTNVQTNSYHPYSYQSHQNVPTHFRENLIFDSTNSSSSSSSPSLFSPVNQVNKDNNPPSSNEASDVAPIGYNTPFHLQSTESIESGNQHLCDEITILNQENPELFSP